MSRWYEFTFRHPDGTTSTHVGQGNTTKTARRMAVNAFFEHHGVYPVANVGAPTFVPSGDPRRQ